MLQPAQLAAAPATGADWLYPLSNRPAARLCLVCFPYAGGSATIFRPWAAALGPDVDVWAMAPPGRATRMREPAVGRMAPIASAVASELELLMDRPLAFFGHSLGALVAFEVARELRRRGRRGPVHLFVSAARAPHQQLFDEPIHALPDDAFMEKIRGLNGTPAVVLDNRELMELLLPALRADFAVGETYSYAIEPPLALPISAFGAHGDEHVAVDQLEGWYRHTRSSFALRMFEGDHFFLHTAQDALLERVGRELARTGATR